MEESSVVFKRLTVIKNFMAGTVLVQRRFRRRQKSKMTKRLLLNDIWDRYVSESKHMLMAVDALERKLKYEKNKQKKAALNKEIDLLPKSRYSLE